eukprot:487044-Amphidinium_carterae.1
MGDSFVFCCAEGAIDARVDDYVLMQLGEGSLQHQNMFDKRPGDLFVLRTAGNILSRGKGVPWQKHD